MDKKPEVITTYQRLKDYTIWYYFRYFPSVWKLRFKLSVKTQKNNELIDQLFWEIGHLFDDKPILESKIQNYIFRNKNKNYIITQLISKQFNRKDIFNLLDKYTIEGESMLDSDFIERKILILKNKNKSRSYIKNKLIEQPEDRQLVENILNEIFWEEWDIQAIENEFNKLSNKNLEQQKIIQKLLQKWFNYWEIMNYIKNNV